MAEPDVGAWALDEDALRAVASRAADLAVDHLLGVRDGPVFAPVARELAARWREESWPEEGCDIGALLDEIAADVLTHPFGNGHPRWHGWVNSPPDRAGVLADLLAAAANPSCAGANQAALHLERQVIRWLADMVGLPPESGGLIISGASLATITALAAARQAHAPFDVRIDGLVGKPPLTVYASSDAHSCVTKAVELLGIGRRNLHLLEPTHAGTLDPAILERELQDARRNGEIPIAVVASAGTVGRGAVDPLDQIAAVCARQRVWLHVDGAYGAPAILSPRHSASFEGIALADSVALDPHKWLYVPVDASVLLVREPERLRDAFSLVPSYLQVEHDPDGFSDAPWPSEYGPEQTRPYRALRVWATLKSTGRHGYRRLIEHDIDLAQDLAARVTAHPELTLDSVGLSIVCFSWTDGDDALHKEVVRRIQLGGEAFLITTEFGGRTVLRACFTNPLTRRPHVDALVDLIVRTSRAVQAEQASQ